MEQLIKSLARNQKLQDIGAVLRGADRVFSVYWRHMGKNILYPLNSSEPRSFEYYYEEEVVDHHSNPDYDPTRRFDYAENQPQSMKDLDKMSNTPPIGSHTAQGNPNQNFSNTLGGSNANVKNLNGQFGKGFSTTARHSHTEARPGVAKISDREEQKNNVNDPHVQSSMNNMKEKDYGFYQNQNQPDPEKDIKKTIQRRRVYTKNLQERAVPSSTLSRTASFAGLGLNLAASAVGGVVKNMFSNEKQSLSEALLTEENAAKISKTFSKMRGIPLKLGQVLSMQEESVVPKVVTDALKAAQKSADIMPRQQLYQVLTEELGVDWSKRFEYFDVEPIAAASIGQVHRARTIEGVDVAVKIQYPGVIGSIDTDINNVKRLLLYPNILPRSLFLDDILKHIRKELLEECDYTTEARKQMDFRNKLLNVEGFYTPKVFTELSSRKILTQEFIEGFNLEECLTANLTQEQKNKLGEKIFDILLIQLFDFGYMQTDPNPANFFYEPDRDVFNMIDFGAAQYFTQEFVDSYMKIIYGTSLRNGQMVYEGNKEVGFLTGEESRDLIDAHVASVLIIGEPFATEEPFDFGNQNLTQRIYEKLPVLLEKRLRPPPQIVYSLHRMLSGGYLMCMKLGAVVHVSRLFKEARARYIARGNKIL